MWCGDALKVLEVIRQGALAMACACPRQGWQGGGEARVCQRLDFIAGVTKGTTFGRQVRVRVLVACLVL